ncbi:hypothetical protein [Kribbella sancticallisti]
MYVGMTRGHTSNRAYVATHQTNSDLHEPHPEQTMQDVLEAVLNDTGVEQSAHEVMRQELDNATRLDRLIPMHDYLCQHDARLRYQQAFATCGLDSGEQADVMASPAYGALIAEFRRAESVGLAPGRVLRQAVTQSPLSSAHDTAAVLHERVTRLVIRSRKHPATIAGLLTPAPQATGSTVLPALRELERLIAERADDLARQAATERPNWYDALENAADPEPQLSKHLLREIAAYRERYAIVSHTPLGNQPPRTAYAQSTHYTHLARQLSRITQDREPDRSSHDPNPSPTGVSTTPLEST